ncbi:type II toxin-antitoxin system mRNA interferase toxin, RelE/StbE family [Chromatium okenii]|uniref:type II toxin-antitoxin system RelE/ParE family toxin n=1 Tax=Chromatium okenii TaxID=61644 RepID=UPI0019071BE3|nr:type II toxin-antitoxin system mRNA interferase toxin, RelE/StbE family [Chromatium okenii]
MAYKIIFAAVARRQFEKLPSLARKRLNEAITKLADQPRPSGVTKLSGEVDLYRVRGGNYRAIYRIEDDQLLILVVKVGHRSAVYR